MQIVGALFILVAAYAVFAWFEGKDGIYTSEAYAFECQNEGVFTIQYDASGDRALLSLSGTRYELRREVSGSGSRYIDRDKSLLFWERQGEAMLRLPGRSQEMTCRRQ